MKSATGLAPLNEHEEPHFVSLPRICQGPKAISLLSTLISGRSRGRSFSCSERLGTRNFKKESSPALTPDHTHLRTHKDLHTRKYTPCTHTHTANRKSSLTRHQQGNKTVPARFGLFGCTSCWLSVLYVQHVHQKKRKLSCPVCTMFRSFPFSVGSKPEKKTKTVLYVQWSLCGEHYLCDPVRRSTTDW